MARQQVQQASYQPHADLVSPADMPNDKCAGITTDKAPTSSVDKFDSWHNKKWHNNKSAAGPGMHKLCTTITDQKMALPASHCEG
jgi:hypothetical protein